MEDERKEISAGSSDTSYCELPSPAPRTRATADTRVDEAAISYSNYSSYKYIPGYEELSGSEQHVAFGFDCGIRFAYSLRCHVEEEELREYFQTLVDRYAEALGPLPTFPPASRDQETQTIEPQLQNAAVPPPAAAAELPLSTAAAAAAAAPASTPCAYAEAAAKKKSKKKKKPTDTPPHQQQAAATPAQMPNQPADKEPRRPPIVVERLSNWHRHLAAIASKLDGPANVRAYGKGLRFSPRSEQESKIIEDYLCAQQLEDHNIEWFTYSPKSQRKTKVAIRGLPADTDADDIQAALNEKNFITDYVKRICGRSGRPGCVFFASIQGNPMANAGVYNIRELLGMPGVTVEDWRGKKGPAQCHRCQKFRHSSHCCSRKLACVRCGEPHAATDCPRPMSQPATCANCGGAHPANHIHCPVFRREARNKRAGTAPSTAPTRRGPTTRAAINQPTVEEATASSLMAPANPPTPRGAATKKRPRNERKLQTTETAEPQKSDAINTTETIILEKLRELIALITTTPRAQSQDAA